MPDTKPPIPTDLPDESPHYIKAVTELGDERSVLAHEDIFASNGMKLLAKGARIDQRQYERLTHHRLRVPLDQSLTAESPVDAALLASEAGRILDEDPVLAHIVVEAGDVQMVKQELAALKLAAPLGFRLTVMRVRRTELFHHSLRVALIAHALALRLGLFAADRGSLLMASLCHDIGEMHTDPDILARGHNITADERRFIDVHPVTGFILLQELAGPGNAAASAILHHHERRDGGGYPYGLTDERIHPLAKVLAVADVAETQLQHGDLPRLDVLLKLSHTRLDPAAVAVMQELLRSVPNAVPPPHPERDLPEQLRRLADVLQLWYAISLLLERQVAPLEPEQSPVGFLFERMSAMRFLVLQAGCNPDDIGMVLKVMEEAPQIIRELEDIADELAWLMAELASEIERRAPELDVISQGALENMVAVLRPAATPG